MEQKQFFYLQPFFSVKNFTQFCLFISSFNSLNINYSRSASESKSIGLVDTHICLWDESRLVQSIHSLDRYAHLFFSVLGDLFEFGPQQTQTNRLVSIQRFGQFANIEFERKLVELIKSVHIFNASKSCLSSPQLQSIDEHWRDGGHICVTSKSNEFGAWSQ